MSKFLKEIEKIYKEQKSEEDFEMINGFYKDKTFSFNKYDKEPNNNCFLSSDNTKNFKFLSGYFKNN